MTNLNVDQLNSMYDNFLSSKHNPISIDLDGQSIDLQNHGVEAFILSSPVSGFIKSVIVDEETDKDFGVVRMPLSYGSAEKMHHDFNYGVYILSLLKNCMLNKAAKHFDLQKCEVVTFKRPGQDKYFTILNDYGGIELRLYVSKTKPPKGK